MTKLENQEIINHADIRDEIFDRDDFLGNGVKNSCKKTEENVVQILEQKQFTDDGDFL
jgi:hypothetical protein